MAEQRVRNGSLVVLVSAVAVATLFCCSSSTRAHGSPLLPLANAVHDLAAAHHHAEPQQIQDEARPAEAAEASVTAAAQTAQLPAASSSSQDIDTAPDTDTTQDTSPTKLTTTSEATRLTGDTATQDAAARDAVEELASLTATSTRLRRQVRAMTTTELNNVCSQTSYHTEYCTLYTRYLLGNRTEDARQCVIDANPKVEETNQVTGRSHSVCTIDSQEKREAKKQYCRIYNQINVMYGKVFRRLMKTYKESYEVRNIYEVSGGRTNPQAVFDMISVWHERIQRYIDCDLYEGRDILSDQDYTDLGLEYRIRTECFSDSLVECWDSLLVELAGYIKTTELLSELGKRTSRLAGCVSIEQVNCCDLQMEAALQSEHLIPNLRGLLG